MDEQSNEQQEALIPDESTNQQNDGVDQDVELDIEALKEKAAKADEYKKYADRVTAENKTLKKSSSTNQSPQDSDERFERLELQVAGYKGEEVDFIMRNGGKSALADPLVTGAIDTLRAKAKSQDATPSGTGKSYTYQKFGEKDLRKMSAEELEKIVPQ
jgi:hypothetical protein